MKTTFFIKLSFIFYLVSSFQGKVFSQDTVAALNNLKQGIGSYNAKNYKDAISYLKNSINEVPTAYAYFYLGAAYCNLGGYTNAGGDYTNARRDYENAKENEYIALSASFNPMLPPKRNPEALHIIKFSDSILNLPPPHTYAGSGDALKFIPQVAISKPSDYNPFETNEIHFNTHIFQEPSVIINSDKTSLNTNPDNTNAQQADNNNTPSEQSTIEDAINDYFNGRTGFEKSLDGDAIGNYSIKSLTNNSITLNVDYNYSPQHGNEVYLGAWFWNPVKENNDAGGYSPVLLSSYNGTAEITITLSDLNESYTTQSIVVFISEPRKGPFTHRIFYYEHTWTP